MAAVAAPVMGPVSDAIVTSLGDSILVEIGMHAGFELTTKLANDLVIDKSIDHIIPIHSDRQFELASWSWIQEFNLNTCCSTGQSIGHESLRYQS